MIIKSGIIHQRKEGHGENLHFCNNDDGNNTNNRTTMVIDMSGNVGIGTTASKN